MGGGGNQGGYKGGKDAQRVEPSADRSVKIPLPSHRDHAEGTVKLWLSSSFGNSFVFGSLRLFGLFQAFINPVLEFLTFLFEPWQFIGFAPLATNDVLQCGNFAFYPLYRLFCCFSIKRAICLMLHADIVPTQQNQAAVHRSDRIGISIPLIPSTKNVLRSNVPSILYSLCTNKFSPAYVPTVPYAPLR